ncbi:hypothetical protein BC829DRAFT_176329 [Chytridium lagenaria]|nr:hypothetical protein BC829DRAFT_176329 [Chytridium lagenaria]
MVDPKLHTAFVEYVELEHCGENIQFYQELTKLEDLVASSILAATIQEAAAYESARSAGSTHALARFLRAAVITSTGLQADSDPSAASNIQPASSVLITLPPLPHTLVPHGLRQRYIDIFSTFIVAGSPQEINVTDATRKRIAAALTPILSTASSSSHNSATNSHSPSSPPGFSDHGVDEAPPATLFNAAGDEIVDLLYRDTFKRFVAWRAKVGSSAVSIADSGSSTPSSARASYEGKRGKKDQQTADDDFEDPLGDLTPDMAMMLLAQAAIQAEQDRDSTPSSATASPSPKKKGITSFWKRKKDAAVKPPREVFLDQRKEARATSGTHRRF